jgi:histidinol-phosphate aminotransferase
MTFELDPFLAQYRLALPGPDFAKLLTAPVRSRTLLEMPDNLPDSLIQALQGKVAQIAFNRYPDTNDLPARIAAWLKLPQTHTLLLGNGASPLIELAIQCFAQNRRLLLLEPDFFLYRVCAAKHWAQVHSHKLEADFSLGLARLLSTIDAVQPDLLMLSNPHNPTSAWFDPHTIEAILTRSPGLVLIDEAYCAFGPEPDALLSLLPRYPNLLLLRSFSKIGAAAIRLGFLVGHQQVIDVMRHWQLPFSVNAVSQLIGGLIIDHYHEIETHIEQVARQRAWLSAKLQQLPGLTVYDSNTNFIVLRLPEHAATEAEEKLQGQGLPALAYRGAPILDGCLRLSVDTGENNRAAVTALAGLLSR